MNEGDDYNFQSIGRGNRPHIKPEVSVIKADDFWSLDPDWLKNTEAKLEALGISPSFLDGRRTGKSTIFGMRYGSSYIKRAAARLARLKFNKAKKQRRARTGRR